MKKALAPHQNHSKNEAASVVAAIVKMPLVAATTASEASQNVTAQKDNNNNWIINSYIDDRLSETRRDRDESDWLTGLCGQSQPARPCLSKMFCLTARNNTFFKYLKSFWFEN